MKYNINITNNKMRGLRLGRKLKQSEVAKILGLDCADRISHWETGKAMPSIINLFKLSAIYDVLPSELYPSLFEEIKLQVLK